MKQFWIAVGRRLAVVIGLTMVVAPIAVYIHKFGTTITADASLWSAMGSAMAGIYGPILTVLTLFVLVKQVKLQHATVLLQQATNKHMYDQAYLQNAREDLDFYLKELVEVLEEPYSTGATTKLMLSQWFEQPTIERLSEEWTKQAAFALNLRFPRIQAIVVAMYPVYGGLSSSNEGPYRLGHTSALQRAIAMLSFPTCVALEHYIYCLRGHQMPFPAHFSPLLTQRSSD